MKVYFSQGDFCCNSVLRLLSFVAAPAPPPIDYVWTYSKPAGTFQP
ncbi:MAG TPA: hypothetical protein VG714_08435 [Acidobacteriaceae bacterium]|nr:hypothetical protein [Acidobacteriaceae bacterium]